MKHIYSKVEMGRLLHIIHYKSDFLNQGMRKDIVDENQPIQLSTLLLPNEKTFRPHKHLFTAKETYTTQESWVAIQGKVKAILYDLDDKIIAEEILEPGDASITLYGGHNYLILEENTMIYEFKTGPYLGQKHDKVFID